MKNFIICSFIWLSLNAFSNQIDPYLWLEDRNSQSSLNWVNEQNEITINKIKQFPRFDEFKNIFLSAVNDKNKTPYVKSRGKFLYHTLKDENHIRGLWRRTTLLEYVKENDQIKWESVLDIDDLAKRENKNWAINGFDCLYPDYDRCLVKLSIGGADAFVIREFDLVKKTFVENGFNLEAFKHRVSWLDKDHLIISTDLGEGTLSNSRYPIIVKKWKRGTLLSEAETLLVGNKTDVVAGGYPIYDENHQLKVTILYRIIGGNEVVLYSLANGKKTEIHLPRGSSLDVYFKEKAIIILKEDFEFKQKRFKKGSLLSIDARALFSGSESYDIEVIFKPTDKKFISSVTPTRNNLLVTFIENVSNSLYKYQDVDGVWINEKINLPSNGTISVEDVLHESDTVMVSYSNFITPKSLFLIDEKITLIKSNQPIFDKDKFVTKQLWVKSQDGTDVPYYITHKKDLVMNGKNPTLLYGYGGFSMSQDPFYLSYIGKIWLENGGIYVLSNIRGGAEFGPSWHTQAILMNKKKSYEDFIAIAEDLIERKYTSSEHLGIEGGSNGGLLVGAVTMMRPDLFNAVVCSVPLLDMLRYHKLPPGASWMGEYGDPDDPQMYEYIKSYSPYHNVKENEVYPEILFTTSTADDRVHPGHARKMIHKMQDMGHNVLLYENIEGGHGGASNYEQLAFLTALTYSFLFMKLF